MLETEPRVSFVGEASTLSLSNIAIRIPCLLLLPLESVLVTENEFLSPVHNHSLTVLQLSVNSGHSGDDTSYYCLHGRNFQNSDNRPLVFQDVDNPELGISP